MSTENPRVHRELIERSREISARLSKSIRDIGPIGLPRRKRQGMALFLTRAVVGQQLSVKAARSIWTRVEELSRTKEVHVSDLFVDECFVDVRRCGVSEQKIRSITAIWKADRKGMLSDKGLCAMGAEQRRECLMSISGVGPWTYDMAQIFYFRLPDVWPDTDVAVRNAMSSFLGAKSVRKAVARFRPYRSYLALSMWRLIDSPPK